MAIVGVVTDIGLQKCRQAALNEGFKIIPTSFGVSRTRTALSQSRTTPNGGLWYQGAIGGRVVVNFNTVRFICTVPDNLLPQDQSDYVREVYIFCRDNANNEFLFAVGHTTFDILYDPTGSVTLEMEISLVNVNLPNVLVFQYTQAYEIAQHNLDPNAHAELIQELNTAGIFLPAGGAPFEYAGQTFEKNVKIHGVPAQAIYGGIIFTAVNTGTVGNNIILQFDGVSTVDLICHRWNVEHPDNPVTNNGVGTEILPSGTIQLSGGAYYVEDGDVVYKDTDGFYKAAISDGTIRARAFGIVDLQRRIVRTSGFVKKQHNYPIGTELFLSDLIPGKLTDEPTANKIAIAAGQNYILLSNLGGAGTNGGGIGINFNAMVTNRVGYQCFKTTQEAIDNVPDNATILIDKLENISHTIDTRGKSIHFYFKGPHTGWQWFNGQQEQQRIRFLPVPTAGTWRIHWQGQKTQDLPHNATASQVQDAFNTLQGHQGVTVTGNYQDGYVITFNGNTNYPLPTFTETGQNALQRIDFSDVPDNGTIRFRFKGENSIYIPYQSTPQEVEAWLEDLTTINDIVVRGSFEEKFFEIEFTGVDGNVFQPPIEIIYNSLEKLGQPVNVTLTVIREGRRPANNLRAGIANVAILAQTLQEGAPVGADTCIIVTADNTRFSGYGQIKGFLNGIDINNKKNIDIEVTFIDTQNPVVNLNTNAGTKPTFHIEKSFGIRRQITYTVGTGCDFTSFLSAYNAAQAGDIIEVYEDQRITQSLDLTKEVTIKCVYGAKFYVDSALNVSYLVRFGGKIKTKDFTLLVASTSCTYNEIFRFSGEAGHHENLGLILSADSLVVENGFVLQPSATMIYVDGYVQRGFSTLNNVVVNNSGLHNHNIVIRDRDFGVTHDLTSALRVQETPSGVINGVNKVFTLSQMPTQKSSLILKLDSQFLRYGIDYNFINDTQIMLIEAPKAGQELYADYFTRGYVRVPPAVRINASGVNVYDDGVIVQPEALNLSFDGNINVQQNANQISIYVPLGAGLGAPKQYRHVLTAHEASVKEFSLPNDFAYIVYAAIIGGSYLIYDSSYFIENKKFKWENKALDGLLEEGDEILIGYF